MRSAKKGPKGAGKQRSFFVTQGLFAKFFSVCAFFLLSTILVLGSVLLLFSAEYFRSDKENGLYQSALAAIVLTKQNYEQNDCEYLDSSVVLAGYQILSRTSSFTLFLSDLQGNTVLCSEQEDCVHTAHKIPQNLLEKIVLEGRYSERGTLDGIYRKSHFTVGMPLILSDGSVRGIVFVSASAESLDRFLIDIVQIFGVASLTVFAVSFVAIYFVTKRLAKPLVNMAEATVQFSKGDFSKRIAVHGDDEVAQLARGFNEMASALATTENMRRSFVANVSHELKTPMTTIGGFIDGILDGTIPKERHEHYLRIVSDEVRRLSRLVRAMLSISRLEAGETRMKPVAFDIRDILCRTIFNFEQIIDTKQLEIRGLDGPKCMVMADLDLIHQVVYNLLDNAVKFVNQGGYIQCAIRQEKDFTYVSVKNSGDGIAKDELNNVFERFYKTDRSRSLDKNGVGLGLYIVKSVIKLHGGDIVARSVEGQYCEFEFSLPTAPDSAQPHRAAQEGTHHD